MDAASYRRHRRSPNIFIYKNRLADCICVPREYATPGPAPLFVPGQAMAMLTPEALGMVPYAHPYISPPSILSGEIRYLHIAQEATFSIGVFVLPPGACIPLHDHPDM